MFRTFQNMCKKCCNQRKIYAKYSYFCEFKWAMERSEKEMQAPRYNNKQIAISSRIFCAWCTKFVPHNGGQSFLVISNQSDKRAAWKLAFKVEQTNKCSLVRIQYSLYVNNFDGVLFRKCS